MNKEELQEIKDSIELQMIYERNNGYRKEYSSKLQEEINLYNEVVRLQSNEENLIKYLEDNRNKRNNEIKNLKTLGIDMLYFRKGLVQAYEEVLEKLRSGKYE